MRGCEGYVIFAQDGIRWAAWSDPMSQSLEQDIQNWILSKVISFSLATTSKRSNAPEVAFYPFSRMRHTATSMIRPFCAYGSPVRELCES